MTVEVGIHSWLNASSLGRLVTDPDVDPARARVPGGPRVECDGARVYWLEQGEGYRLRHSGADWTVEGGSWGWARLTVRGGPLTGLRTERGEQVLDRAATYIVVPLDPVGCRAAWELLRVTS
ncbi:hypothetical protein [Longispora urticae]